MVECAAFAPIESYPFIKELIGIDVRGSFDKCLLLLVVVKRNDCLISENSLNSLVHLHACL